MSQAQAAPASICGDTREAKQVSKKILTDSTYTRYFVYLTYFICRIRKILLCNDSEGSDPEKWGRTRVAQSRSLNSGRLMQAARSLYYYCSRDSRIPIYRKPHSFQNIDNRQHHLAFTVVISFREAWQPIYNQPGIQSLALFTHELTRSLLANSATVTGHL